MRRYYRRVFRRLPFAMVVVGESPLAGTLRESTICALTLGIRVVLLDNAYAPWLTQAFVILQGWLFDGIVLTGPSSLQMRNPPEYYCGAPPYIEGTSPEAGALLDESGLRQARLITVLGYEQKAERLAIALLPRLVDHNFAAIFLTLKPEETRERLASLPPTVAAKTLVLRPPSENLLFGLFQLSSLVIGKCGYMQVSECLALRTPFLAITYRGCFPVWFLPARVRRFVHATSTTNVSKSTMDAAVRLLHASAGEMESIHDGRFGARTTVADFLERLPAARRSGMTPWTLPKYRLMCLLTTCAERMIGTIYAAGELLARLRPRYSDPKTVSANRF